MCYWPPYPNERLIQAIKKCESYMDNWQLYEVKSFRNSTYADYHMARQKERKAEVESDLGTDTECQNGKRKRFQRVVSSEDERDEKPPTILKKPPQLLKGPSRNRTINPLDNDNDDSAGSTNQGTTECLSSLQQLRNGPNPSSRSSTPSSGINFDHIPNVLHINSDTLGENEHLMKLTPNTTHNTRAGPSTSGTRTLVSTPLRESGEVYLGYFRQIIRKQNIMQATLLQLVEDMSAMKKNSSPVAVTDVTSIFTIFDFPLKDEAGLGQVEEYLQNEQQLNDMIEEVSKIGGSSIPEFVKRVLSRCISNTVLSLYSWIGLKKKKNFSKLLIAEAVIRASLKNFPNETRKTAEEGIKNSLRRAKERQDREQNKFNNL